MIVILIWSLNLIFNKMAFLVLLCVYFGSFLSCGFFSSLTPTPAYTWALLGPRTCQGQRRAGFSVIGERLKHFAECCLLGSFYSYRGMGEGSSNELISLSAWVRRRERPPHPWVKPLYSDEGTRLDIKDSGLRSPRVLISGHVSRSRQVNSFLARIRRSQAAGP